MTLVTCSGILLRSYAYSDSSSIFRFLTSECGLVSVIGKGVRRKSAKGEVPIQSFSEGTLTFHFRPSRDLHPLRDFQGRGQTLALGKDVRRFTGASLVAELVLVHKLQEPDPELYEWIRDVLLRLAAVPASEVPGWTLAGGWRTLAHLGYPPEVSRCIRCGRELDPAGGGRVEEREVTPTDRFDVAAGGVVCAECAAGSKLPRVGPRARADLASFVEGSPPPSVRGEAAHLSLLEAFALHHLAPRSAFKSFSLLRSLPNNSAPAG